MTPELLPCPFCGSDPMCADGAIDSHGRECFLIECCDTNCGMMPEIWDPSQERAIKQWNTRRADPPAVVEPPATTINPNPAAAAHAGEPQAGEKPTVVCLCGSTRFMDAYQAANLSETIAGRIVLSIGCNTKSDTDLIALGQLTEEAKAALDELHKRKIDLADEILVLNVGGYVGQSTRSEIEYAQNLGKGIRWLESGGTTNETGDATAQAQVTGPQSNRQHAGEGKDAERYRALRRFLTVDRDEPGEWTCWLALACVPYRSKTENPDDLVDKIIEAFAERAPLVGREREPQPDLSDQIAMGMEKGRKLAEEAKKIRHGGGTLT